MTVFPFSRMMFPGPQMAAGRSRSVADDLTTSRLEALISEMDASTAMAVASQIACHPNETEATRLNRMWAQKTATFLTVTENHRRDDNGRST